MRKRWGIAAALLLVPGIGPNGHRPRRHLRGGQPLLQRGSLDTTQRDQWGLRPSHRVLSRDA
jgi:hypothetical protein